MGWWRPRTEIRSLLNIEAATGEDKSGTFLHGERAEELVETVRLETGLTAGEARRLMEHAAPDLVASFRWKAMGGDSSSLRLRSPPGRAYRVRDLLDAPTHRLDVGFGLFVDGVEAPGPWSSGRGGAHGHPVFDYLPPGRRHPLG